MRRWECHNAKFHIYLSQELAGYSVQGLLWPSGEPVDGGIVDQAGEVAAASSQCVPDRRHAEHNVQIVGGLLNKVRPAAFSGGEKTSLLYLISDLREGGREGRKDGRRRRRRRRRDLVSSSAVLG